MTFGTWTAIALGAAATFVFGVEFGPDGPTRWQRRAWWIAMALLLLALYLHDRSAV